MDYAWQVDPEGRCILTNLAGKPTEEISAVVAKELQRVGIQAMEDLAQVDHPEVKTAVIGKLGAFTFRRHWYYYSASGPMPIENARELYATEVGKRDIRVSGHCGCPAPDPPWITLRNFDGRIVVKASERPDFERFYQTVDDFKETAERDYIFDDDPDCREVTEYIELYDIDSELGLYLFAEEIRKLKPVAQGGAS